jgi:protein O-mannosyl-transferase
VTRNFIERNHVTGQCQAASPRCYSALLLFALVSLALLPALHAEEVKSKEARNEYNQGNDLQVKGKLDEAIPHFQKALEIEPRYAEAHNNLGIVRAQKQQLDEAVTHFEKALEINPDFAEAHHNLGLAFVKKDEPEKAITHFEKAIKLKPDYAPALRNLAYLLAASDKAALRDGERAVELAQRANELAGDNNPNFLATLAAAYAEAGNFPQAVKTVDRAIQIAREQKLDDLDVVLDQHIRRYKKRLPLR